MTKSSQTRTVFISFFILLIMSACEQSPKVELTGNSEGALAYFDEVTDFKGLVEGEVFEVEIRLNEKTIETVTPSGDSFSFKVLFDELGENKLSLVALDAQGKNVAEAHYKILVVERSDVDAGMFDFDLPAYEGRGARSLWATYYYLPEVRSRASGHALRDLSGRELGPVLSLRDWCNSAMEGSVRVVGASGEGVTYNYAGTSSAHSVDCTGIFPRHPATNRVKFRLARGSFGDGVRRYKLVPFRTIAVDSSRIPYGSIVYIPEARGNRIVLPDGSVTYHDGYFFAGDTGGAIKGTHIDVYIGVAKRNPFSWVKSRSSGTFSAYVVSDPLIKERLSKIHVE